MEPRLPSENDPKPTSGAFPANAGMAPDPQPLPASVDTVESLAVPREYGPVLRARSLPDEIASLLRQQVAEGKLRPGDRLPSESSLCAMLRVSRPVLREAVAQLRADGVLRAEQGRGVFVEADPGSDAFRLTTPDFSDKRELQHILELLIAFEVASAGLAALRRSPAQLAAIKAALDDMAAAIRDGKSGVAEDVRFHREIVNASANPLFVNFGRFLEHRCRKLIRTARENTARFDGLAEQVQEEHRAIFEAIAGGCEQAARRAAQTHLHNAARRLQLYIDDRAAAVSR